MCVGMCVSVGVNECVCVILDEQFQEYTSETWLDHYGCSSSERESSLFLSGVALAGTWLRRRVPGVVVWRSGS